MILVALGPMKVLYEGHIEERHGKQRKLGHPRRYCHKPGDTRCPWHLEGSRKESAPEPGRRQHVPMSVGDPVPTAEATSFVGLCSLPPHRKSTPCSLTHIPREVSHTQCGEGKLVMVGTYTYKLLE